MQFLSHIYHEALPFFAHMEQVRMQAMGDTLLLHWQPVASSDAPKTLELRVPDYVAETPSE